MPLLLRFILLTLLALLASTLSAQPAARPNAKAATGAGVEVDAAAADAAAALAATGTARVFATGGETARSLCVALGVRSLRFEKELEPGLAAASGTGTPGPLLFAVKPGGFGDDDTWLRAADYLGRGA